MGLTRVEPVQQFLQTPWKFLVRDLIVGAMELVGHCAVQFPLKLGTSDVLQEVHEGPMHESVQVFLELANSPRGNRRVMTSALRCSYVCFFSQASSCAAAKN